MTRALPIDPATWSAQGAPVCLCRVGARTALGHDAAAAAAAVRAALAAVAVHPFFVDRVGAAMKLAWAPGLDPALAFPERMRQLLTSALEDMLADLPLSAGELPQCWIGLPEPRPGMTSDVHDILTQVAVETLHLHPSAVRLLPRGHASGLIALQAAAQQISSGAVEMCVVAAVDSYHDADTLEWLDHNGWLMSRVNRNGFPPGEGAGACLLASERAAARHGLPVAATLVAASTAREPHSIRGSEVCVGLGLTAAIDSVVSAAALGPRAISAAYCDLNGERYRNEELAYTLLRVQEAFRDAHDYVSPADCWGDVGAASGPLFAALAVASLERGYAEGRYPLLWAGSESGYRSAALLNLNTH